MKTFISSLFQAELFRKHNFEQSQLKHWTPKCSSLRISFLIVIYGNFSISKSKLVEHKCQTIPDRYPLPNIADFLARLYGSKVFTKLDLTKGYYQVPITTGDIPKTEVITTLDFFEWLRMPFGLRNSECTLQRLMDQIFQGLTYCFV